MSIVALQSCANWLPITQNWMYNHIRRLPDDIKPHIVCYRTENLDKFGLPDIHDISDSSRLRSLVYRSLSKLNIPIGPSYVIRQGKKCRANILHSHFGHIGWENLRAAARLKVKHIVTFYGFDVNYLPHTEPIWHERYKQLFAEVDCVLCEGSHMKKDIVRLGCHNDKIVVQHLGVDVDDIKFKPRIFDKSKPLRILIAATFQEKKGITYALEALGKLRNELNFEITIIGDANEETKSRQEKQQIISTVERYNLQSRTNFLSFQPHSFLFEEAYRNHIFLSPSITARDGDTEGGLPVSILEMAATGMAIVSTTHCDIPEAIHQGTMGLLADEKDAESLASLIRQLVKNHDQWYPMLHACRKHIENEYNVNIQAARLGNIYRNLVANDT
jgi:colanic acid/amylovoran biosynthesis glycosyltransferase